MNKKNLLVFLTLIVVLHVTAIHAIRFPDRKLSPSIQEGISWKYSQFSVEEQYPDVTVTVLEVVSESVVKLRVSDGLNVKEGTLDVTSTDGGGNGVPSPVLGYLISEGLEVGDPVIDHYGQTWAIDGIVIRNVLGQTRELCQATVSEGDVTTRFYWDKSTGIPVQYILSGPAGTLTTTELAETSLWSSDSGQSFAPFIILIIVLVLVSGFCLTSTKKGKVKAFHLVGTF